MKIKNKLLSIDAVLLLSCQYSPAQAKLVDNSLNPTGLGKRAGFVRNAEMGYYADALLAFWDKNSRGTKQMIDYATKKGLIVKVVYY